MSAVIKEFEDGHFEVWDGDKALHKVSNGSICFASEKMVKEYSSRFLKAKFKDIRPAKAFYKSYLEQEKKKIKIEENERKYKSVVKEHPL